MFLENEHEARSLMHEVSVPQRLQWFRTSLYCYSSSECCAWFDVRGSIPWPRFAFRPTVYTNAASTGCQFGSESLSWPLPLCGNASTGLPSWKAIEVVHGYCLHRLDASSYQECIRQLNSRVLFSAGPQHGTGPSQQRSVISRMRSLFFVLKAEVAA